MPITTSAKKSLRKNMKRRGRNILYKKKTKELIKKARLLASEKKLEEIKAILPKIQKSLDKAAKRNVIKKNTASRKKSRIAKMISKIKAA